MATIPELQAKLAAFRASQSGAQVPTTTPQAAAPSPDAATVDPSIAKFTDTLATYRKQRDSGTLPTKVPKDNPNALAEFAKSIFTAPATIVARPFQAAAELAGVSDESVNKFSHDISGGLIAPTPQNYGDVKKDVGRAAETVALGTGAPIAGGALFGAGASLEQGNDLLSAQTAVNAAIGGAGGKVLEWVGKPLLDAAGKVVGTITPKIIKDVAAGGADAITKFAATHDLPLGISTVTKPLSQGIERGANAIDNTINAGFKQGGDALKKTAAEQFPGLNPVTHYTNVAERDLVKPTTLNDSKFAKATSIYDNAKARGIDLGKVATQNSVFHDDLIGGGKFNTLDAQDALRQSVYKEGSDIIRPALKDLEPGTRLVPVSDVRNSLLSRVDSLPAAKYSPEAKAAMKRTIEKRYSDTGAEALAHPNGYTLTDLHDSRIERGQNGKYIPGVSDQPTIAKARLARQEEATFKNLFDNTIPKEVNINGEKVVNPLADIRREHEKTLLLADYLKSLNGKKVPEGATKRAVRLFGRAAAATVGGKVGGFPGAILGSQYGDMLFSSFEALPNPLKRTVLSRLKAEKSPAYDVLQKFVKSTKAEREMMLKLPAGGSSGPAPRPTLFTTPGGVSTPVKNEAIDLTAVEQGRAKAPKSTQKLKDYLRQVESAQTNQGPYTPPNQLPQINAGPRRLTHAPAKLTPEAVALIDKVQQSGSVPVFITAGLRRVAADNGIAITDSMTAADVVKALIRKQSAYVPLKEIKF